MKNIVITGGSRGIGRELVEIFLQNEEDRVSVLTRNTAALAPLQDRFAQRLNIVPFDITRFSEERLRDDLGAASIDILINNAGYLANKPFAETTDEEWQATFDTNFFGIVKLVRALLPLLGGAGGSHIVNIGSMGGFPGSLKFPGLSAYSASKGALAVLTECLAEEFRHSGTPVWCNCLCLGSVNTEMLQQAFPGYTASNSPEEMGKLIALFAREGQKFFNGKVLPVSVSTP